MKMKEEEKEEIFFDISIKALEQRERGVEISMDVTRQKN